MVRDYHTLTLQSYGPQEGLGWAEVLNRLRGLGQPVVSLFDEYYVRTGDSPAIYCGRSLTSEQPWRFYRITEGVDDGMTIASLLLTMYTQPTQFDLHLGTCSLTPSMFRR